MLDLTTLETQRELARALSAIGAYDQSLPMHESVFNDLVEVVGGEHPKAIRALEAFALDYSRAGKIREAHQLFVDAVRLRESTSGLDNVESTEALLHLANSHRSRGELDKAMPIFEQVLDWRKKNLPEDSVKIMQALTFLGMAFVGDGNRLEKALDAFSDSLTIAKSKLGPGHTQTLTLMNNIAYCLQNLGRLNESTQMQADILETAEQKLGQDHPLTMAYRNNFAHALHFQQQLDRAIGFI